MKYFISDLHFDDDRIQIMGRDIYNLTSSKESNDLIIKNWNNKIKPEDTVYVLGDVTVDKKGIKLVEKLNGYKILIKGNYDEVFTDKELLQYFDAVYSDLYLTLEDKNNKVECFLNHYPGKAKDNVFNLVGHIHGLWRVQRNMLNVSADAWNLTPISEETVMFFYNAVKNYYDKNVFAGELKANKKTI